MIDEAVTLMPRYKITPQKLAEVFPDLVVGDGFNDVLHEGIIDSARRLAALLAQVSVTTDDFRIMDNLIPDRLRVRCQRVTGIDPATIVTIDRMRLAVWYWNLRGCSWLADRGNFAVITIRWTQNESPKDRFLRYRRWKVIKEILGDKNAV